jgi:hypothetical protein
MYITYCHGPQVLRRGDYRNKKPRLMKSEYIVMKLEYIVMKLEYLVM